MPRRNPAREEIERILHAVGAVEGPECEIPRDAATAADHRNPRRRGQQEEPEVGVIVETELRDELDLLVLHEDCKRDILAGLRSIELRADLERIWNISQVQPMKGRCILNFYGEPGTGKTRVARAIARRLGKKLYQVDYSAVISKYLGDTAKHIAQAFKRAEQLDAVLFFDEADSLLSKRVDMNESCSTSINQNRNVLMQCLDRFPGVVIMTTNLFGNYDEAMLRRIAKHIEFKLPNRAMRRRLFELHLPNRSRVDADLLEIAKASKGLSGGDILNVCLNSIFAGSIDDNPEAWKITSAILTAEIDKVIVAKEKHAKKKSPKAAGPIGFAPVEDTRELEH
jgi:ATP-dependent 26S proteasome regulatory subunit